MTDVEGRLIRLELMVRGQAETIRSLLTRAGTLEQQGRQPLAMMWQGGGGGAVASYWCLTPAGGGPATGTWGTLTPATFTADVYSTVAGAQVAIATGATVYWWYNDTFAANKPMPLMSNDDGTYDAIAEGCTAW